MFLKREDKPIERGLRFHRRSGGEAALVLIHGFLGDPVRTWGAFPTALEDRPELEGWDLATFGYSTSLLVDVPGLWSTASPPIDRLADLLATEIEHGDLRDVPALALIAHSMGGLVVQQMLVAQPKARAKVRHVTLFGTPSGGLVKASLFARWNRQLRDLGQDSRLISELRQRWSSELGAPLPFSFLAVAGAEDEFVPASSSLGPFPVEQRAVVPGNHLEIVKPSSPGDLSVRVAVNQIVGDAAPAGPWNAARVAVETGEFHQAVAALEPHAAELDDAHLVTLALALEGVGRSQDALEVLERGLGGGAHDTDAMGVLAGRLKRRWLATGRQEDAERALALYGRALERSLAQSRDEQVHYHAINVAFLELAFRKARDAALSAAHLALQHAERVGDASLWSLATQAEASLILGDHDRALVRYRQAIHAAETARAIASMYRQAIVLARILGDKRAAEGIEHIFRGSVANAG